MLRPLVDGECGGQQNALTRFTSHLGSVGARANAQQHDGASASHTGPPQPAPATFDMHALVSQLHQPSQDDPKAVSVWTAEYLQRPSSSHAIAAGRWRDEYAAQLARPSSAATLDNAWAVAAKGQLPVVAATQQPMHAAFPNATQLSTDFLAHFDANRTADRWTAEFLADGRQNVAGVSRQAKGSWAGLEQHWDTLAKQTEQVQDWYQDYDEFNSSSFGANLYKTYTLSEDNPYAVATGGDADAQVALAERLLASGELHAAILHFEAAVRLAPQHGRAWLGLGRAQSENEQEPQAIAALRRALEVMPSDLAALFSLSVAYTNECMYNDAMQALANWLRSNPDYEQIKSQVPDWEGRRPTSSFMDREYFTRLESAFLTAAARQPNTIDANLQNALGVLYNMSGDFSRAKDCFQSAISAEPNDARTWNRLGATLANSGEPSAQAEAVQAYGRALQLYPAYVRARYNLGIACLHMKSHREALEHMVTAAVLQDGGKGPYMNAGNQAAMSDSIWHTMRVAAMGLSPVDALPHREQLMGMIDNRDLRALSEVFQLDSAATGRQMQNGGAEQVAQP